MLDVWFFKGLLKLLFIPSSRVPTKKKGLVIVLFDGLSYPLFQEMLDTGKFPFLKKLLTRGYECQEYFCGLPATTTATISELFYGDSSKIPSFSWYDRSLGQFVRGNNSRLMNAYERTLLKYREPLIKNGSCVVGVFSGGAKLTNLSSRELRFSNVMSLAYEIETFFIALLHPLRVLYMLILFVRTSILVSLSLIYYRSFKRAAHVFKDTSLTIFLGDLVSDIAQIELFRETPALFVDLTLYDDIAHIYGPEHPVSVSMMNLLDLYCQTIYTAAWEARREYEFIVMSDHGNVPSRPFHYYNKHGLAVFLHDAMKLTGRKYIYTKGSYKPARIQHGRDVFIRILFMNSRA
jgi:hypothetical protein